MTGALGEDNGGSFRSAAQPLAAQAVMSRALATQKVPVGPHSVAAVSAVQAMPCQRYPSLACRDNTSPRYWLLRSIGIGPSIIKRPQTLQVRRTPPFFRHWSLPCLRHAWDCPRRRPLPLSSSTAARNNPPGSEKASSLIGLESLIKAQTGDGATH